MSSLSTPSSNFLAANNGLSKQLVVVVDIDGLPLLGSLKIMRYLEYGDAGYAYGGGSVYGQTLVPVGSNPGERQQATLLMPDQGSLTISQRLEPEQARGSISTMNLSFLDKDGYMTKLVASGPVTQEILGSQVKIWIGYEQNAWPNDYFVVWRGRVGQVICHPGVVEMQFLDPNVVRRQQIFYCGQTTLGGNLSSASENFVATYDYTSLNWTASGHNLQVNDVVNVSSSNTLPNGYQAYLNAQDATYNYLNSYWTATSHGFSSDQTINLVTTGVLPSGYFTGTDYYITVDDANTFQLSYSPGGGLVGATIDNGSGTHTAETPYIYYVIGTTPSTFQLSDIPPIVNTNSNIDEAPITGPPVLGNNGNGVGTLTITRPDIIVPVASNLNFFDKIPGPAGNFDANVRVFLNIDDEFIEYQQIGNENATFGNNVFTGVTRGVSPVPNMSTPSTEATHEVGATVDGYILIEGHAMDIALKLMLSGFDGPYQTDQAISGFVTTNDPNYPSFSNGIVLPANMDAVRDLGLVVGDYIYITGDSNPGNNVTCTVIGFNDLTNQTNNVILTSATFTASNPSSAVLALRSQYDVWPVGAGCALPSWEVDIGTFQYYKNTFLNNAENSYLFLLNETGEAGKTFIESEILLPLGAYSLTRQGKLSMGLTKPPIADQRTQVLNVSNIFDPQNIVVQRGVNNRKFFNEIDWSWDCDETNTPTSQRDSINADSLNAIGISSILPITSRGARTFLGFLGIVADREQVLFNRYARASVLLDLKVTLGVGNQVEAGDILVVSDNGQLQIANFTTGLRNFGTQYMEVINRSLDLRSGVTTLQLEGGTGALISDRYATIAPSSVLGSGNTASRIIITESFGSIFPFNEQKKWTSYVGLKITVHSTDFLVSGTTVFTGLDPNNNHAMLLSPALGFTPQAGMIVELEDYPTNTNAQDQAVAKLIHGFVDPTVPVASGISSTQFTVSAGNIGYFIVGQTILLRNATFTIWTQEVQITNISTYTITVSAPLVSYDLTIIPDASLLIELIGFQDSGAPYRLV